MSEPPRFGVSGNSYSDGTFGGHPAPGQQPFQPFPPSPSGGGSRVRTLLFAFGITFGLAILACGGLVLLAYNQFSRPNAISEAYRENREQPGEPLPESLTRALAGDASGPLAKDVAKALGNAGETAQPIDAAQPVDAAQHPQLKEFFSAVAEGGYSDGTDLVNAERMYQEMRDSGLAVGLNELNKIIYTAELGGSYVMPMLDSVTIVDSQWLVPEREMRVAIASYSDWTPHPSIYLLYLIKSNGVWQIYDHHDLLHPLSVTQQLAALTQLPYAQQDKLLRLEYDLDEVYSDGELSDDVKAQRTTQAYRRRSLLPEVLQPEARWLTLKYLMDYDALDEQEQFLNKFPEDQYPGAHFARGLLAFRQERFEEAFRHFQTLIQAVGWHPAAAVLAGDAARTEEERQLAAGWLQRGLDVVHGHPATIQNYFKVADAAALRRLTQRLQSLDDGDAKMIEILSTYPVDEYLQRMLSDNLLDELPAAKRYCQFALTIGLDDPQSLLSSVKEILEFPDLAKIDQQLEQRDNRGLSDIAWSQVLQMVDQFNGEEFALLNQLIALSDDPTVILQQLRDQTLYDLTERDSWDNRLRMVERAQEDETIASEPATQVAWAICQLRLEHPVEAFEQFLRIIGQHRNELLSQDETPEYMYSLFEAASESAVKTGRWQELVATIDEPETAYLVVNSYLSERMGNEKLQTELNAWYEQQATAPFWLNYFRAQQAYAMGNWERADQLIEEALDGAFADPRSEDYSFANTVYTFAPYSEDASEWMDDRIEWADRSGHLRELVQRLISNEKLSDYIWSIEWKLDDCLDVDVLQDIGQMLGEVDEGHDTADEDAVVGVVEAEQVSMAALAKAAALNRDYDLATTLYQQLIDREIPVTRSLVQHTLNHPDSPFLDMLSKIEDGGTDTRIQWQTLAAIQSRDSELLAEVMADADPQSYALTSWGMGLDILPIKAAGLWPQMNEVVVARASYISDDYKANGMLLLPGKASEQLDAIASNVAAKAGVAIEPVPHLERLPGAVGAWTGAMAEGSLLVVAYDEPLRSDSHNEPMDKLLEWSDGIVCISLMQTAYGPSPASKVRELAIALSQPLDATGYFDFTGLSFFRGEDWTESLAFAIETGINRDAPTEHYFHRPNYSRRFNSSDDELFVGRGLIVEALQIEPYKPVEEQTSETDRYRLLEASVLVPALSVGDILKP